MENKSRKKWGRKDQEVQLPINAPAVKEEILPQYGEHLLLLQERNRLIKKLKRKDKKQILLERKENGFALYVNGANADGVVARGASLGPSSSREPTRHYIMTAQDLIELGDEKRRLGEKKRARTAPSKTPRKTWNVGSVDLTTDRGKRKVKAPDYLTGNYDDDFEPDESSVFNNSSERKVGRTSRNGLQDDSDSDIETDESLCHKSSDSRPSSASKRTSYLKTKVAALRKEEESNRLNLTIADVKKLRQSLEMNAVIKRSLAMPVSSTPVSVTSSDDDEEIVEEIDFIEDEDDSETESPIEEEDEESDEIAEELVPAMDSVCLDGQKTQLKNPLKPNDTIVLEFAPAVVHRKIERNLSAPRKKDIDLDSAPNTPTSKQRLTPLNRPLSSPLSSRLLREMEHKPVNLSKKSSQPLSAHRKNEDIRQDSKQEASAVMKAMQAENEKAKHFSKEYKISDRPQIRPSSGTPQTSSSRLSTPGKNSSGSEKSSLTRDGVLTEDKMHSIITKVLGMSPKQQRNLMKTLGKLEETTKEMRPLPHQPVKATAPVSVMHNNNKQKCSQTTIIEVNVEILSNWGSPSRVGLTEMQFFDQDGHLIPLDANDISVHGATGSKTDLDVLCNGKMKTTKERYMWVCNFSANSCVEFVIMLQNPSPHKHFEISTIKLWNYNKSLNQLDIGAKHVRIFVGGELVFDGDVEKGCGNQVFDYCSVISVSGKEKITSPKGHHSSNMSPVNGPDSARSISRSSQSSASSSGSHPSSARQRRREEKVGGHVRSETRTMAHSTSSDMQRPTPGSDRSESSPENQEYQDNVKMPEKRVKTPRKANRLAARLNGQPAETEISDSSQLKISASQEKVAKSPRMSTDKLHTKSVAESSPSPSRNSSRNSPLNDSNELDDLSMMQKLKEMNIKESQRKKEIPMWLKSDEIAENSGLSGSGASQNTGRSESRVKSRQADLDLANMVVEELEAWPQAGLHTDSSSPRSDTAEALDEITPMQKIQKKRSQWKTNDNLEEEWGCLNYFNKQQKGRLSIDMGDDDFDEYFKDIEKTVSTEPTSKEGGSADEEDGFVIPELPSGKELIINIVTTWGDHHYVGLTGVDIFSSSGESVTIKKITAKPLDINVLDEYNKDPRVVSNIIDGVNRTRDDVHMWLAPFTPGSNHCVYITFDKPYTISMIRFWNYNKSRIHSYRGAKDVIMLLDGKQIFKGEIARACGGIEGGTEAFGDTILFTMDDNILELVSKNDDAFEGDLFSSDEEDIPFERPSTADNDSDERPFTRAAGVSDKAVPVTPRPSTSITTYAGDVLVYKARSIELNFTATWGDHHYLGLTGLEIVGKDGEALPLNMKMISAKPRDLHSLPGHEKDDRTLDKLIDGNNITSSDEHMWLVPFSEGKDHTVTVSFTQQILLSGLRIWNYNKSPEDTYRGPRILHVKIDGRQVSPADGYLIRKGPGNCHFDFAQEINFQTYQAPQNSYPDCVSNDVGSEYEVVQMPCGFIFQLQLFSTWGDQYYVGLNGIEFYDSCFNVIQLIDNNISAYPDSVNVLDNVQNDVRTPDKLIDGVNSTMDGRHMWLAPVLPGIMNRVYVIFDQPTTISMIKIWNYSKTPNRGTKDFALLVDDLLIYNGCLKMVSPGARGILPTCEGTQAYHTVLFTNNKEILKREKTTIISNQPQDQDVQLLNDKKIVTKFSDPKTAQSGKPANQALRPKTSVPLKRK